MPEPVVPTVVPVAPSYPAKVALVLGILNTGGLLVLGSYCLYGAVDHTFGGTAAVLVGLGAAIGRWRF